MLDVLAWLPFAKVRDDFPYGKFPRLPCQLPRSRALCPKAAGVKLRASRWWQERPRYVGPKPRAPQWQVDLYTRPAPSPSRADSGQPDEAVALNPHWDYSAASASTQQEDCSKCGRHVREPCRMATELWAAKPGSSGACQVTRGSNWSGPALQTKPRRTLKRLQHISPPSAWLGWVSPGLGAPSGRMASTI